MIDNLDDLAVFLAIALPAFALVRPLALRFLSDTDFARRRNVWLALTAASFITPSFWLYALLVIPFVAWCARKDPNPLAVYIVAITAVPPLINFEIPGLVINALFRLDSLRVLALAILVPAAWRAFQSHDGPNRRLLATDILILAYVAVVVLSMTRAASATHTMRGAFILSLDLLLPYFVASRACYSRRDLAEVLASFCLICAVLAPLALFESLKGWLLFHGISVAWNFPTMNTYEYRAGFLRAQVSGGHSLAFGNIMAIGFGAWLYLSSGLRSLPLAVLGGAWMWMGLVASWSRGPWVAGCALLFAFLALRPKGATALVAGVFVAAVAGGLVAASPIGDAVIDRLPFVGTVGERNVSYRQLLIVVSWEQIKQNPLFGNPSVLASMEELRQGEGIIDLLNVYLTITLYHGLAGLLPYVGFLAACIWRAYRPARALLSTQSDASVLGTTLASCLLAYLLMLGMGGVGASVERLLFVLAGLAVAYPALLGDRQPAVSTGGPHGPAFMRGASSATAIRRSR